MSVLPVDRVSFAFSVFTSLGGNPSFRQEQAKKPQQEYQARRQEWDHYTQICELAGLSFWYVQLEEGLGHPPEMKEFGLSKFKQLCPVIHEDVEKAWNIYREAIEEAKQGRRSPQAYQVPESSMALEGNRPLPISLQVSMSPLAKNQPPEQKRSWLDRLLRRH